MMRILGMIGALLTIVLASGCISSASTTVEGGGREYKVATDSLVLNNHIRVIERSTRRVNGLLEAQVRAQNVKGKDVQFEYRFIWLDQDGIRLDTELSVWKPLPLRAKEIGMLSGIAPAPVATDFIMAVRFAQQSTTW